ncbi:conserved Plasmodium protein, unknown function [Plasmodium berghei]|uniref:Protein HGH1 N-terminal domain-containing protein n=2 Tax=Plasmodium berghei TaxID=5821 RepID=A0A509AKS4_PLABA|nr:conserved Plasmodium protein, unknown function [Plasmodium berghei ANKA]CXI52306.1 conserved Plasmodium protein, unknown function [Plasmodium berghei]SCL94599.1 conserved Plasmodium protein, unknown function [Plasmodium berghei]SCM16062.1 conserved Plasmodium protein, unknown function [Plasmodium berghei]SCM17857.1 conserved Plasmodium protein, unknown function [Plasmodium berghei]SCN26155.1 conserved Plasmodium protein, unknown function [Plasmodium berghei]|eukprot:XP_034421986.1 conserved Plasmodium protein, unknown function [Plasmodium berghei ANKA]
MMLIAEEVENAKNAEREPIDASIYNELFSFAASDNEILKKESLKIILGLLDETDLIAYILQNSKKCFKIIISSLNSQCKMVALECLLNLSAQIPTELIERNIVEILFDMIKDEEKIEENYIDMYIMIISNITRCKEGIYKILDINEEGQIYHNTFSVSYYLNKLLFFYFQPITPSINKNMSDKYMHVSHILINISSIKESMPFFKNVAFLNKLSEQILILERCRTFLPFIMNLSLHKDIHDFIFQSDCNMFPYLLSYVYTPNTPIDDKKSLNGVTTKPYKSIHKVIVKKSTSLVRCSVIKNRILVILLHLSRNNDTREKIKKFGVVALLNNWKANEKAPDIISEIKSTLNKFEDVKEEPLEPEK